MSDSLRPHGLFSPWNSPGQNTGVGSLSLLQGIFPNPGIQPRSPTLQVDSLASEPQGKPKNTAVGSLSLLQRFFQWIFRADFLYNWLVWSQGSNPGLPHCRQILYLLILYQLSHQESARILEWVAFPFSSRFSQPRNWTGVSCIPGGFFTNWAIREAWSRVSTK